MSKKSLINHILVVIIAVVLTLISVFPIGILGIFFTAALSALIGYSTTKHHYTFVASLCVLVFAVTSLFTVDTLAAVTYVLPTLLCGLSLGIAHNIKFHESKTIVLLSCIHTINLLANIKALGMINGKNFLEEALISSSDIYRELLETAYGQQFSTAEINELMSATLNIILKLIPAFVIIAGAMIALLYFYCFIKALKITKVDTKEYIPFSEWKASKSFTVIFLIITSLMMFSPIDNYFGDALMNVFMVSLFIFFVFGLSFLDFLFKRLVRISALRKLIIISITLISLFTFGVPFIALFIAGILNGFIDFRSKIKRDNLPE